MSNYDASIKPIETRYKGYRFRSRLEARWAVFFDEMGFEWQYEPEGYSVSGASYLPDFRIGRAFIEIKRQGYRPSDADIRKWNGLACVDDVIVIMGPPPIDGDTDDNCLLRPQHYADAPSIWYQGYIGQCRSCGGFAYSAKDRESYSLACRPGCEGSRPPYIGPDFIAAARAARSARFEHGESGAG